MAPGSVAGTLAAGDDTRLSDARTPIAHAGSHQLGGIDAIKLDDLATPDDNTDLNASTSRHGLLRKLDNDGAHYLDGQGNWSVPAGEVSFAEMALRDIAISKNGAAPLTLLINAFADGFKSVTGINAGGSSNYDASENGVIKPTTILGSRITGGTPTVSGGGTAANINDNSTGTLVSWTPGNVVGQSVAQRMMAKIDLGSVQPIRRIEVKQHKMSSSYEVDNGLYYSSDGTTWTQLGASITTNTTPTDTVRDGNVNARYVGFVITPDNYSSITVSISDLNVYGGDPAAMDVKLTGHAIADAPDAIDVMAIVEETDALTVNTDLVLSASRDGGTSYAAGTASKLKSVDGKQLWFCPGIDVSGQPAGSSLSVRIQSASGKGMKIHGIWARRRN
jgi:hypothetical protein